MAAEIVPRSIHFQPRIQEQSRVTALPQTANDCTPVCALTIGTEGGLRRT